MSSTDATKTVDVRVVRRFSASPEQVFDAWLQPDMVARWMFDSSLVEQEVVRMALDARVGGTFSFVVRRQDEEIDHIGEYLEMVRPERLAFTWAVRGATDDNPSRVVVEITRRDDGCELTLTHELQPEWAHFADRARDAWERELALMARAVD